MCIRSHITDQLNFYPKRTGTNVLENEIIKEQIKIISNSIDLSLEFILGI